MNRCPHSTALQDFLDGILSEAEARAFRQHLAGCAICSVELAGYLRVFTSLRELPLWEPVPELAERVMDRVLPSRSRRRWVRALGWGYGGALAATLAGLVVWVSRPDAQSMLWRLSVEASERLALSTVFVFRALAFALISIGEGGRLTWTTAARFAPLGRALSTALTQPALVSLAAAALVTCLGLVWWMRPRPRGREVRHVGILGF